MMLTFLLARVFGTYLIIAGVAVLARKKFVMSALGAYVDDKLGQLVIGLFEIIFGLIIINIHYDWSTIPSTVVTLLGWAMFLKGVFIMLAPESLSRALVQLFSKRMYVVIDGVVALVLGAYLAGVGYGFL